MRASIQRNRYIPAAVFSGILIKVGYDIFGNAQVQQRLRVSISRLPSKPRFGPVARLHSNPVGGGGHCRLEAADRARAAALVALGLVHRQLHRGVAGTVPCRHGADCAVPCSTGAPRHTRRATRTNHGGTALCPGAAKTWGLESSTVMRDAGGGGCRASLLCGLGGATVLR